MKPFRKNLLVIPSAESSCILVQADTILMLRSSTTYNKKCYAQELWIRIRIDLTLLDPDPYWDGSGSRSQKIDNI